MKYEKETRGQNFYALDANLQAILGRLCPDDARAYEDHLSSFGAWVGSFLDEEADYTDRFGKPRIETYDRYGETVNRIAHNALWEQASEDVYRRGIVGLNYQDDPASFLVTFAMGYLTSQSDPSLHCPVTMTGAVAYVIDKFAPPAVREKYLHQLTRMDGRALTGGTWATELHGGSDVGATTTTARDEGDHVRLNGLKWFTSNANGGLAVATARPVDGDGGSSGLGLYLVPTHLDDGSPNPMRLRRLKDKLGTVGVPTGEIDLEETWAVELAPPPLGFKLMMEALEFSRIQNAMASVGMQRRAFLEVVSYCAHREAFGNIITRYPMVQDEILKILVQLEAGMALAFEAAHAFQGAHDTSLDDVDNRARTWMRVSTALAKYQTAERAIDAARGAIEIIGGNAYTYDYCTPRLLRDAQVTTVWEGPANIQALELLRLLGNRYAGFEAFETRVLGIVEGASGQLDPALAAIRQALDECRDAVAFMMSDAAEAQRHARKLLAMMADILAAALLAEEADAELKDGNARKALVLRLFVEAHLDTPPARRGIGPGQDWAQRNFEALVGYEAIDAAVLEAT